MSVPVLDDSRSAKSTETAANDRLLHFMAQPPKVEKLGEFGMTAQFLIEVQPLFIRNSFQQFFACVPSFQPKSRFVPTEVDLEQYPHLKTSFCAAPVQDFAVAPKNQAAPDIATLSCRSAVHGLAMLVIDKKADTTLPVRKLVKGRTEHMLDGLHRR